MNIKLVATDLDGTFFAPGGIIPERNRRAFQACAEKGIITMFCSGRAFEVQAKYAMNAGLDPVLSSANGARIDAGINGPTLLECTLERNIAERIYAILMEKGIYFMIYARGKSYIANPEEMLRLGRHRHEIGVTEHAGKPYEVVLSEERIFSEALNGAYKFVCFGDDYDKRFIGVQEALAGMNLSISSSWRDNIEIMSPGVDKGSAIRFVAEKHGISMDEVMVFGDNSNDLPMLRAAGWPVAMGNSEKCALELGRIIAPDCGESGVGQILEKYVLNEG